MPLVGKRRAGATPKYEWLDDGEVLEMPWEDYAEIRTIAGNDFFLVEDEPESPAPSPPPAGEDGSSSSSSAAEGLKALEALAQVATKRGPGRPRKTSVDSSTSTS